MGRLAKAYLAVIHLDRFGQELSQVIKVSEVTVVLPAQVRQWTVRLSPNGRKVVFYYRDQRQHELLIDRVGLEEPGHVLLRPFSDYTDATHWAAGEYIQRTKKPPQVVQLVPVH